MHTYETSVPLQQHQHIFEHHSKELVLTLFNLTLRYVDAVLTLACRMLETEGETDGRH